MEVGAGRRKKKLALTDTQKVNGMKKRWKDKKIKIRR